MDSARFVPRRHKPPTVNSIAQQLPVCSLPSSQYLIKAHSLVKTFSMVGLKPSGGVRNYGTQAEMICEAHV